MQKLTILGSANAVAKADQQNTHLLVESDLRKILVDCGDHPAVGLARVGVHINQVTDLILTHSHADHMGSLPLLLMDMWLEKRESPLKLYGLEFTLEKAKKLLDVFDWLNWKNMFPVQFIPVNAEGENSIIADDDLTILTMPVVHLVPTLGLRFTLGEKKTIAYSCDTEPCAAVETLAKGVDVLLQEAAGPGKGHTSPAEAGEIAARCAVKRLILIHYEARRGGQTLLAEAASTFHGPIDLAVDGMSL